MVADEEGALYGTTIGGGIGNGTVFKLAKLRTAAGLSKLWDDGETSHPLTWTSPCEDWSLTSLKEKLIKIGAKVVSHGRYVAFQMAEVAIPKNLFADILRMIAELRPPPDPTPA